MPFDPLPKKEFAPFKKTEWMDLKPGKHIVRVIGDPYITDVHNVRKGYLKCWGAECPICQQNKKIISRNPENFRKDPEYCAKTQRMYVNVLDLTPVKICPNPECKAAVKKEGRAFPDACPACGRLGLKTVEITPLNKIVVLNMGKKLYDQFVDLENAIKDAEGAKLGVTNFDVILTVSGAGTERTIMANETEPLVTEEHPYVAEDLFDLKKALLVLPANKINDYRKGANLKDIFASIKPSEESATEDVATEAEALSAEMQDLFAPKNE